MFCELHTFLWCVRMAICVSGEYWRVESRSSMYTSYSVKWERKSPTFSEQKRHGINTEKKSWIWFIEIKDSPLVEYFSSEQTLLTAVLKLLRNYDQSFLLLQVWFSYCICPHRMNLLKIWSFQSTLFVLTLHKSIHLLGFFNIVAKNDSCSTLRPSLAIQRDSCSIS